MKVILQNNSLLWLHWAKTLKDSTMENDVGIKGDNVFFIMSGAYSVSQKYG